MVREPFRPHSPGILRVARPSTHSDQLALDVQQTPDGL